MNFEKTYIRDWQKRFRHGFARYNDIYPHVCRHTYGSLKTKAGINPKTFQYLMGHSDISVTNDVYTHVGLDDAEKELRYIEEFREAQEEIRRKNEKPASLKMFKGYIRIMDKGALA